MDHALRNALVVGGRDPLAQDEIFRQRETTRAEAQRVLVVRNPQTFGGGEGRVAAIGVLVQFTPASNAAVLQIFPSEYGVMP